MIPTVLVVDKKPGNIYDFLRHFHNKYTTLAACNPADVIYSIKNTPPDAIILQCDFCCTDCQEMCDVIKANDESESIPIILILENEDMARICKVAQTKITDYVTKTASEFLLIPKINNSIKLKLAIDTLHTVEQDKEKYIANTEDSIIIALASLAETRDDATGSHIKRTQVFVRELASALKTLPQFSSQLDDFTINMIVKSVPLHDIGKVGIPDSILLKPGVLSKKEFDLMKTHTTIGLNAINSVENVLADSNCFIKFAKEIIFCHHERWDGGGYPQGISECDIPISARLMSIADVYDALVSKRVYKDAFLHERAIEIIAKERESHFDPILTDVFLSMSDKIKDISESFESLRF